MRNETKKRRRKQIATKEEEKEMRKPQHARGLFVCLFVSLFVCTPDLTSNAVAVLAG
jgi:hypothetical protein